MMFLSRAADVVNGAIIGADVMFTSVSKDTRSMSEGALYVALKGENYDGHLFLDEASDAGAVAALVSEQQATDMPQLTVSDTRLALGELAASWRDQFKGGVLGVTGSNGKTTVKEMCRCILAKKYGDQKVLCTHGNLNNDIGLPMTILGIRKKHEVAVIEMGANHCGEIKYLTEISRPDVAVITNAGTAHIEGFGSLEKIAYAKSEIFDGLSEDGIAIINADDEYCDLWKQKNEDRQVVTFSMLSADADVVAHTISGNQFTLRTKQGEARVTLQVPGQHNIMNALAATAAALSMNVDFSDIIAALGTYTGMKGRLRFFTASNGACVIDDSYNANPYSLDAAMSVLVALDKDAWLVLGDMGELGDDAEKLHREAGLTAKRLGVKRLFATGEYTRFSVDGFGDGAEFFDDKNVLASMVREAMDDQTAVLVKGSRSMRMEEVVSVLVDSTDNKAVTN